MSERQSVEVDLDKLRARIEREGPSELDIDLLFAMIETLNMQAAKAETARLAWTEIGARSEADAGAIRMAAQPAANLLFNLDQRGGLGQETHRVIKETQLALDSALHDHGPGAALLAELSAARAVVEAARLIDRHVVGAYETDTGSVEPCDECGEMREIAAQALKAYDEAMKVREP